MKKMSNEEFKMRRNAKKFANKVSEEFAKEMKIMNGDFIHPKKAGKA